MDQGITAEFASFDDCEIVPVEQVLKAGVELRKQSICLCDQRDPTKKRRVRPIYNEKQMSKSPKTMIRKIEYPPHPGYQECRHDGCGQLNVRLGINREQQLKILSTPNRMYEKKAECPMWVQKPIHGATFRLAELARPKKRHVQMTWSHFANVLDPYHIENCQKYLRDLRITDTKDAAEYFQQKRNVRIAKRQQRHREIKDLARKIQALNRKDVSRNVQAVLDVMYLKNVDFLLSNSVHLLTFERLQLSNYLLKKVCEHINYVLPKRSSKSFFDMFIVNLCDNLAIYLSSVKAMCGYDVMEEWKRIAPARPMSVTQLSPSEEVMKSIPIDAYIGNDTDDASSTECDMSEPDVFDVEEGDYECEEEEDEKALSDDNK